MFRSFWVVSIVAMLLGAGMAVAQEEPQAAELQAQPQQMKQSEYWLGVEVSPASEPLRAQLGLGEGEGLAVQSVMPDSPAAKAGIQQHDVLLRVNDKRLKSPRDLILVIDDSKEKEVSIVLIHGGKEKTVQATPQKRPEDARLPGAVSPSEAFEQWFRGVAPEGGRGPLQFRFVHPGVILPSGAPAHMPLPGNMSVAITKQGDKPAEIVVKRGDENWEVTEKDLGKLPADIRPHVERMLGGWTAGPQRSFEVLPSMPGSQARIREYVRPTPKVTPVPENRNERNLEKRLDDLNQQMDQMRRTIEELRRSADKAPGVMPEQK